MRVWHRLAPLNRLHTREDPNMATKKKGAKKKAGTKKRAAAKKGGKKKGGKKKGGKKGGKRRASTSLRLGIGPNEGGGGML